MPGNPPELVSAEIGKRIREARVARGLDLFALAQKLHLAPEDLKRIEEGVRPVGSAKLWDISVATGAALTDFSPSLLQAAPETVSSSVGAAAPSTGTDSGGLSPCAPGELLRATRTGAACARAGLHWWIDSDGHIDARLRADGEDGRLSSRRILGGLVRISQRTAGTEVALSVRHAGPAAYRGLIEQLESGRWTAPILLRLHYGAWHHEAHGRARDAAARVAQVQGFQDVELTDTVYLRRLEAMEARGQHPLIRSGMTAWERSGGRFAGVVSGALDALLDHLLVYRQGGEGRKLITVHAGPRSVCARLYGEDWARRALGRNLCRTVPGPRYGDAVSDAYWDVLHSGRPWFGHIRAILDHPTDEAVWVAYQRLLLRCLWTDGLPVLVCLSVRTQNISIPFLGSA